MFGNSGYGLHAPSGGIISKSEFKVHTNPMQWAFRRKTIETDFEVLAGQQSKVRGRFLPHFIQTLPNVNHLMYFNQFLIKTFKVVSFWTNEFAT